MTFSIVAADHDAGDWGIAVASRFPCVGAVVPWAKAGVGAVATQSWANTAFGPEGLRLMAEGVPAEEALRRVLEADEGSEDRQVGFRGRGRSRGHVHGLEVHDVGGGATGPGFAAQGNILVGEAVVAELVRVFSETEGDLCDRLLAALLAGDAAGGDRRGRQSAALLVVREGGGYEGRNDRYIDLRVDDHPDAPRELARLFDVWDTTMLIRNDRCCPPTPELVRTSSGAWPSSGSTPGSPRARTTSATRMALGGWAGEHNLEGRLRDDDQISNLLRARRSGT